mmetsp:Transcript_26079/g.55035  ORF Transcript_26079/g.55035 Transcript_26079/m.55035 type:complete len:89 (+) Transcript_26079:1091-1357(+)
MILCKERSCGNSWYYLSFIVKNLMIEDSCCYRARFIKGRIVITRLRKIMEALQKWYHMAPDGTYAPALQCCERSSNMSVAVMAQTHTT